MGGRFLTHLHEESSGKNHRHLALTRRATVPIVPALCQLLGCHASLGAFATAVTGVGVAVGCPVRRGYVMGAKSISHSVGLLAAAFMLSGCQSMGALSLGESVGVAPPPTPASFTYAQVPGWTMQASAQASAPAISPQHVASATPRSDSPPSSVQAPATIQLVNASAVAQGAAPVVTITIPAVKMVVPMNQPAPQAIPGNPESVALRNPGAFSLAHGTPTASPAPAPMNSTHSGIVQAVATSAANPTPAPSATPSVPAPSWPRPTEVAPVATETIHVPPPPPPIRR
jgi:hypothetical protein